SAPAEGRAEGRNGASLDRLDANLARGRHAGQARRGVRRGLHERDEETGGRSRLDGREREGRVIGTAAARSRWPSEPGLVQALAVCAWVLHGVKTIPGVRERIEQAQYQGVPGAAP